MHISISQNRHADHSVQFLKNLTLTGEQSGQPFNLIPWQEEGLRRLFGTLTPNGQRRFTRSLWFLPRKSGKTELAASIVLYCLLGLGEPGQEIVSAASDREQAGRIFKAAAQMIRQDEYLSSLCIIRDSKKEIELPHRFSTYKALSCDVRKSGKNTNFVICDEIHEWSSSKGRELWDVLSSSFGARSNPLFLSLTTAGIHDPNHFVFQEWELACRIAKDPKIDPHYLPIIYQAEQSDDWTDEKTWHKAMPGLKYGCPRIEFIRSEFNRAKVLKSEENKFRRFYLNQWVNHCSTFFDMAEWDKCPSKIDIEELKNQTAYGALDLSLTTDITAFVLLFEKNGIFSVLPNYWIPEAKLNEQKDGIDYRDMVQKGIVRTCPGRTINYDQVRSEINEICEPYQVAMIACDSWGAHQISNGLFNDGFLVKYFRQGFLSMSEPTKELEKLILEKRFNHGGCPVLRFMARNTIVRPDPLMNIRPDKKLSREKIDGIICVLMSLGVWLGEDHSPAVSWN